MLVKICGITNVEDAIAALDAGADYIGLNLVAGPRRIDPPQASRILARLFDPSRAVALVSLDQGRLASAIAAMLRDHGVRRWQLYGEVTPEAIGRLETEGVETFHVQPVADESSLASFEALLTECSHLRPKYVLFDAAGLGGPGVPRGALLDAQCHGSALAESPSQLGGTGRRANWAAIAAARDAGRFAAWPPVLLAGGLTPDNVAEAIATVAPAGVDVSSGVESRPGRKDRARVEAFVAAARGHA